MKKLISVCCLLCFFPLAYGDSPFVKLLNTVREEKRTGFLKNLKGEFSKEDIKVFVVAFSQSLSDKPGEIIKSFEENLKKLQNDPDLSEKGRAVLANAQTQSVLDFLKLYLEIADKADVEKDPHAHETIVFHGIHPVLQEIKKIDALLGEKDIKDKKLKQQEYEKKKMYNFLKSQFNRSPAVLVDVTEEQFDELFSQYLQYKIESIVKLAWKKTCPEHMTKNMHDELLETIKLSIIYHTLLDWYSEYVLPQRIKHMKPLFQTLFKENQEETKKMLLEQEKQ